MENPQNPLDNQKPVSGPEPPDDLLLDALQDSIVNPPGLAESLFPEDMADFLLMDDLGRSLGHLEAKIDGIPTTPMPLPERIRDDQGLGAQDGRRDDSPQQLPPDSLALPETAHDLKSMPQDLPLPPSPGVSTDRAHRGRSSSRPHHRGGGGRRTRGYPRVKIPTAGRMRTATGAAGTGLRFCCQNGGVIDAKTCQSCEKYRHWPEGTDEEPRECWHQWRQRKPPAQTGEDEE